MKIIGKPKMCDCCREFNGETYTVKFPAVDTCMQYQEFCKDCATKFTAWRKRKITVYQLYDKAFKLNRSES